MIIDLIKLEIIGKKQPKFTCVSSPESWPFKIIVKTLILNGQL
jgi:hypothetical protein